MFFFRGQIWWHSATAQPQPTKYHETWFVLSHSFWRMQAVRLLPLITEDSMAENTGVLFSIPSLSRAFALFLWLLCPITYFPFFLHIYVNVTSVFDIIDEFSRRYFYAISSDVAIDNPGRIVKVDTQTSKVLAFSMLSSSLDVFSNAISKYNESRCRAGVKTTASVLSLSTSLSLGRWGAL